MRTSNPKGSPSRVPQHRSRVGVLLLPALLLGAACSSENDDATPDTTASSGVVELPQNPSLALTLEDGVWYVENDGNVTMSDVAVSDDGGEAVCEIGTIAPEDRQPCEGAGADQSLVASGQGPQGQPVEVPSG